MLLSCGLSSTLLAQSAANPGVVEVDDPARYSQVLAMSDAHGMFDHLTTLLRATKVIDTDNHWIGGKSLLVVCGDSIDKGPNSLGVLHLWMHLTKEAQTSGGRVIILLGNHEAEFLSDPTAKKSAIFRNELTKANLVPADVASGKDAVGIGNFLRSLPIAARVGRYLLAHAGWYPAQTTWEEFTKKAHTLLQAGSYGDEFVTGKHSILEEKDEVPAGGTAAIKWYDDPGSVKVLETRLAALHLYGVVMGHQPKAFGFIGKIGAADSLHIIKVDTGMAPDAENGPGELLCFKHPAELTQLAAPEAERLLADGTHAPLESKKFE